jgi:hypothetical protein
VGQNFIFFFFTTQYPTAITFELLKEQKIIDNYKGKTRIELVSFFAEAITSTLKNNYSLVFYCHNCK